MSTQTFREVVFTVKTSKGDFPCVGVASDLFRGLVVREEIDTLDDDSEWIVSHLPTGHCIPSDRLGALSLAESLSLAVSLAALGDWSELHTVDDVMAFSKTRRDGLRALGLMKTTEAKTEGTTE